jgi:hypothetical protein
MGKHTMESEYFLKTIATHEINVKHDIEAFRTVEFRKPTSGDRHFSLTTWPYHLCISGDMGTYVFKHYNVEDMFKFFRSDELGINDGYWSEKLVSNSLFRGFDYFDHDAFTEAVKERFDEYCELDDEEERAEAWEEIEDNILCHSESEDRSYDAIWNYDGDLFEDLIDGRGFRSYGANYLWCLYAIVWGIQQYDK